MADIITYPENGITYDADDASGYLSTRLSGVYSADEDFAVTANGDLTVTVSAGQAWVRPARFRGRSIIMEQPETVTLTAADTVRNRIDRLVLRYDATAKKTSLTVLTGTPDSASPTAPEITRTTLVYDLCLADIRRPAASTAITAADITDTRADEAVCGLMRDGVTGIPTQKLVEQWQAAQAAQEKALRTAADTLLKTTQQQADALLRTTKQQADALLGSYTGGYLHTDPLTLAPADWTDSTGGYPYQCIAPLALCTAQHVPLAVFAPDSQLAATSAGVAPLCKALAGSVCFYARTKPSTTLTVQLTLFGPQKEA
nr:MAG TPA: Receptor Binding Protein [Caudoviricetes sp.]